MKRRGKGQVALLAFHDRVAGSVSQAVTPGPCTTMRLTLEQQACPVAADTSVADSGRVRALELPAAIGVGGIAYVVAALVIARERSRDLLSLVKKALKRS